jgi:hypothetical protein
MDRRTLELRVQEFIDSGCNPCDDPELSAALRKHPELRRQAEELYRVDQMLRCSACSGETGCECDSLLNSVMDKVEDVSQDAESKSGSWVFRVGLPAAAAATLSFGAMAAWNIPTAKPLPFYQAQEIHRNDGDPGPTLFQLLNIGDNAGESAAAPGSRSGFNESFAYAGPTSSLPPAFCRPNASPPDNPAHRSTAASAAWWSSARAA